MDNVQGVGTPSLGMWLTDRSRYETGVVTCKRNRLYKYHHGPHGYGWDVKAASMPTLTGGLVHEPITAILGECAKREAATGASIDILPDPMWVYTQAILPAIAQFSKIVDARGLGAIVDPQELGLRIIEQSTLLEGLVWTWYYTVAPGYIERYKVVLVEAELPVVLGCTCGLGAAGTLHDHDARACEGIGYMTRGDVVAQDRLTGTYRYDEFKTTTDANPNWQAQWGYRTQVLTGVLGAEQALGVTIDEVWIHALIKGRFQAEWDSEARKASGPRYQNSVLCYGWRQPANPPLTTEIWAHSYTQAPDPITGKGKRLPKSYARTGIWELPASTWQHDGVLSASHYWCLLLLNEGKLNEQYTSVGPLRREAWRLEAITRQIVAEEVRVQTGVWALYKAIEASGFDWTDARVLAAMDEHFPQAGGNACHSYFGAPCPFLRLCTHQPGWETPDELGYLIRRPHHAPELEQMTARGLAAPEWGAADESEDL